MAAKFVVHRNIACILLLALLAACASNAPRVDNITEAAHYEAVARNNYAPPGTPDDPWGPYIVEAANRFDVPQRWIREVMNMESGGQEYIDGQLTTSATGAMGLMQVEPETYDDLRSQYGLGGDPYDPHDNILAGTAYMRQLYDQFGTPGFLAAYNAGPGKFSRYLAGDTNLPDETRHYVAVLAPAISGTSPINPSPNDQLAYNLEPAAMITGRRATVSRYEVASNDGYERASSEPYASRAVVRASEHALAPPIPSAPPPMLVAYSQPHPAHRFSLISEAYADTLPAEARRGGSYDWSIQVGAYASRGQARSAAEYARAPAHLFRAVAQIGSVAHGSRILYRARLAGISREEAENACDRLARTRQSCIVVSPAAS